jgi:NO-binding membrane sensor protein with MHYT domain
MEIHHFEHGWVTPAVSYTLSVLGSLLGLVCAVRLRAARTAGGRAWWLALSAIAIGGTGIWTMHFVAMLGFSVVGTPIRYDAGLTAASAVLAIAAVGAGMMIVFGGERARALRIIAGGVLAGLGVAAMHYMGMYAMHLNGDISYGRTKVAASVAIAVVAATVALWLTVTVQKPVVIFGAALIMGVAVNGMHFTGMAAMTVRAGALDATPSGAKATALLIPIGLAVVFGALGLVYALMATPTDEDRAAAAYLAARLERSDPAARPAAGTWPVSGGAPPEKGSGIAVPQNGARIPQQRRSALGDASWTYRDRSPRQ